MRIHLDFFIIIIDIKESLADSIYDATWLTSSTKNEALRKLIHMDDFIGFNMQVFDRYEEGSINFWTFKLKYAYLYNNFIFHSTIGSILMTCTKVLK